MSLLETDTNTNINISAATEIGSYTADAERQIMARVFLDQIAGNGDYVAYLTIQRAGAGSAYRVVPITTAAVASGVTSAVLTTISIPVSSGDVVKCYVDGLAGDTATPDTIVEWWQDSVNSAFVASSAKDNYGISADSIAAIQSGIASGIADWTDGEREQIRQALGVSGDVADTTGEGVLDLVMAKTDLIGVTALPVRQAVDESGNVQTYQGDDYKAEDGRALVWSDAGWPDLSDAEITVVIDKVIEMAGSVVDASTVMVEPVSAQTALIRAGEHEFQVISICADGDEMTLVTGVWESVRRLTAPVEEDGP